MSKATTDIWKSMGLDVHLSEKVQAQRKATGAMMDSIEKKLEPHVEAASFPDWIIDHFKPLGINGLSIKDFGAPGMNCVEQGSIIYEIAKRDGSIATFFLVHNAIGMEVIDKLGNKEQRERLLPAGMKFEKIFCFGLTEPLNGSDATGLKTTATKVEGGYALNGQKRWIGNATMGDVIVWARNTADGNKIQAFVVERGSKGFSPKKMEGKFALRMTQNADIEFKDCFVPEKNKLEHAKDFATGTNAILEASRLTVAWMAAGLAAGAYEAALKYTLQRVQFGRPIARFQLIQERLSRMLANCEFSLAHLVHLSKEFDKKKASIGQIARTKAHITKVGRETVALAREVCGGNGILLENRVMKSMLDMEAMYTYEGTYDINSLVSGRELTGGLSAIK